MVKLFKFMKDMYYLAFIIVRSWVLLTKYERTTGDIRNRHLRNYRKWEFKE